MSYTSTGYVVNNANYKNIDLIYIFQPLINSSTKPTGLKTNADPSNPYNDLSNIFEPIGTNYYHDI
jgi:hypothetical protein